MKQLLIKLRKTKLVLIYRIFLRKFVNHLKWHGNTVIQLVNYTYPGRHPDLFTFAQNFFKEKDVVNALSFGCSVGDECISILNYLPTSKITGIDINRKNITIASKKNSNPNIEFIHADILDFQFPEKRQFNVIFILSVLCIEPEARFYNGIEKLFSFDLFERIIVKLDEYLLKGGLIIIRNSNYLFEDSSIAGKYTALMGQPTDFPTFDKSGTKVKGPVFVNEIFMKVA